MKKEKEHEIKEIKKEQQKKVIEKTKLQITKEEMEDNMKKAELFKIEMDEYKKEVDLLSFFNEMSHYTGIPTFLLRKITKQLEETVNNILSKYSLMTVFIINEKETSISIQTNTQMNKLNVKMLCGSEKFLIELAFRVAFQVLSNVSTPNFMICDEGWSCLDEEARSKLNFLFESVLEYNDYILTVSHIKDVKQWMTKSIYIHINEHGKHKVKQM
jgi:DNA repair exonuclease SbcCD ATPase subunit